ncbi:WxL protein peptidoglycan domain-containing protein [Micromonospora sp. WMMA1923]|uniref:WxL protein peptidoglycan domain-containing protein n=1 Tax=Micromonospora sp. WMMA1923 TaxID=3404125 RepID=UPI003B93E902
MSLVTALSRAGAPIVAALLATAPPLTAVAPAATALAAPAPAAPPAAALTTVAPEVAALAAPSPGPGGTGTPAPTAAAGVTRWAVQPSSAKGPTGRNYFIYDLAPGSTVDDHVGVSNLSDRPLTFEVYGTDAYTTTDGAFALLPADQPATGVGSWVSFDRRRWTIDPGERADIPFTLTVPANATPGDHAGGVIGALAQTRTTADGQRVLVDQRLAARVYLRVTGEVRPAVTIEQVTVAYDNPVNPVGGGELVISYRLRNSGNVRTAGTGAVTVAGPLGWELARTSPVDLPELLPDAVFTVTERITGVPPAVRLRAEVDLAPTTVDTALPPVRRSAGLWAPPWLPLALLATAAGWFGVRHWRHRRATAATGTPARTGDTAGSPPEPDAVPGTPARTGDTAGSPPEPDAVPGTPARTDGSGPTAATGPA